MAEHWQDPRGPETSVPTDSLDRIVNKNIQMRCFLLELLNPEQLGHAVTPEVRDKARALLNLPRVEAPR